MTATATILRQIDFIAANNVCHGAGSAARVRTARNECLLREARRAVEVATTVEGLAVASSLLGQIR
jgi:hypothetical protein